MDFQILHFFITIADTGSFSKASEELHYAQSNLSSRIKSLEDELGEILFYREKRGVSLTTKGQLFYRYAKDILHLSDEARIAVSDDSSAKGRLSIGSIEAFATYDLPALLSSYHSSYPDVQLSLEVGLNHIFEARVLSRDIDGAFVAGPVHREFLDAIPVKTEKMVFAVSFDSHYQSVDELLSEMPIITFPSGSAFRACMEYYLHESETYPKDPFIIINSLGTMIASICAGIGCGFLPESILKTYQKEHMVKLLSPGAPYSDLDISFIYRKDRIRDAAFRYFLLKIQNA